MNRYLLLLTAIFIHFGIMADSSGPVYNPVPIHEAFVTRTGDVMEPKWIPNAPPSLRVENIPPQPFPDAIWIPGYWSWVDEINDFAWVCGIWRRPSPGLNWISGYWVNNQNGWTWAKGFWSQVSQNQLVFIPNAPPASANDNVSASPGKNYFWAPGYWNYVSGQYSWLSGKWQAYNQNWILTPACYTWRPNGYVFTSLFWDYPLDQRGNAYSCTGVNAPLVIIEPSVILENCYIYYPNYISLYSWWWFYNPGYWSGCSCLPPWWFWGDWWAFAWGDAWDLWWWWGHPGDFPPFWISFEISIEIAGPDGAMIEFMKNIHKPQFPSHPGQAPLLPTGPINHSPIPRPQIPITVAPQGTIQLPQFPNIPQSGSNGGGTITVPTAPTAPMTPQYTPPTVIYNTPDTTYYPPTTTYTPPVRTYNPPTRTYNPPTTTYNPPSGGNYTPPTRGGNNYTPPTRGGNNYTPPTTGGSSGGSGKTTPSTKGGTTTSPRTTTKGN